jgi:hypothetical protein
MYARFIAKKKSKKNMRRIFGKVLQAQQKLKKKKNMAHGVRTE